MTGSSGNRPFFFPRTLKPAPGAIIIMLILLGALFFIPGLGRVHLFDWDEANFAEASREMLSRGNWLQVTIDYQPFYEKPPLFFWLQALSMKAFGINEFAARFVNAVCGIATLVAVFTIGSRLYGTLFGLLWALAFFGSFLPHLFFKSGIIDPLFNLLIFSGLTFIIKALLTERQKLRTGWFSLAGASIGLATLAKGPVALLIICLVMFVFRAASRPRPPRSLPSPRSFFRFTDIFAFFTCTAAVACLFFGMETGAHGTAFIKNFIVYQIRLLSTGESGHGQPFYFHFFVLLFGCFPASIFAVFSFTKRNEAAAPRQVYDRFMIILFWVVLVLFSIVKTKTVLYSSLAWFPVTYLGALYLWKVIEGGRANARPARPLMISLLVFSFLVCLAITLFPVLIIHKALIVPFIRDRFAVASLEQPVRWSGHEFLLGIGYGGAMAVSLFLYAKKRPLAGALGMFGSSALCLFLFMFIFAPKIEEYSQGGPVAFYKAHAGENVYVRSLFKSYTDLYYSRTKPAGNNPLSHDKEWLLRGPIDRPAYFVAKITQSEHYDDPALGLVKLASAYGFVYYRRDVPGNSNDAVK